MLCLLTLGYFLLQAWNSERSQLYPITAVYTAGMNKRQQFSITLPKDTLKRLDEWAGEQKRSRIAQIEYVLDAQLSARAASRPINAAVKATAKVNRVNAPTTRKVGPKAVKDNDRGRKSVVK